MKVDSAKFATNVARWAGVGPYYAMFPTQFCDGVIADHTRTGDTVLDPFAGRGTAVFSAAAADRMGVGVELNPVGWIYAKAKLSPAPRESVEKRILYLREEARRNSPKEHDLPEFFQHCFSKDVLDFLLCARRSLSWRANAVDRTVMALMLIHLHGKDSDSLSNQMRQTKAMAPRYAVAWWKSRGRKPPQIDVVDFFRRKCDWRYARGTPRYATSSVYLGDSTRVLPQLARSGKMDRASLLLTSPPYFGITNYHYDQWLRLWLLGGPPTDSRTETVFRGKHRGKFSHPGVYAAMIRKVFLSSAMLMKQNATIYVRTDRRQPTLEITEAALRDAFPRHKLNRTYRPVTGVTQTRLFGHYAPRIGEVDLVLSPR